jgi:aspartyl-tRNA(Asn)/glutamyl-tRNA(Gln) amidotransferase subunit A
MGSTNENSVHGACLNPLDLERVPGGSSGGSAAAVAEGLCDATLGTDTGGSVRQPAAFCGVVGFKPSYGRISRHGIIAYGSSFDQVGIFANNVEDTARIAEVISGQDHYDATSASNEVPDYSTLLNNDKKLKIAYIKDAVEHPILDPEISASIKKAIEKIKAKGHTVEPVDFKYTDYMVPTYYVLTTAEASSNLARYDGVHYGHRSENANDTESTYVESRTEGFGLEVKRRIMTGTFVLSSGYYDAYYGKAQKVRQLITQETEKIFDEYDFIISPTTPEVAFKQGEKSDDPIKMYLSDIFTVHANLAGIPAISMPLEKHSNGMPMAIQFSGKKFDEANLFAFADSALN